MGQRWWVGDARLSPAARLRHFAANALATAVVWWCGSILDRPGITWWKHGVVALPLGLVVAAVAHVRSWDYTRAGITHTITRARTVWLVTAVWVAGAVGYAVYRNGPAQYVAAAILAVGAVAAATSEAHRQG